VKVGNDRLVCLSSSKLAEEPSYDITKDDGLVGLVIVWRGRNPSKVPKISLPLVHPVVAASGVKEENERCALDEPSTVINLTPRSFIALMVSAMGDPGIGSSDSTSMGAVLYESGPIKTTRSPYSLTVTGTLVLMTV